MYADTRVPTCGSGDLAFHCAEFTPGTNQQSPMEVSCLFVLSNLIPHGGEFVNFEQP